MESIRRYEDSQRKNRGGKRDNWYDPSRGYGRDRRENSRDYDRKGPNKGAERRRDKDSTVFIPMNARISKALHEIKGKAGLFGWLS